MGEKEKTKHIISQSEAAKIANVSRQAISGMKKANSQYNFFTDSGSVDTNSKDWKTYLSDRKSKNGTTQGGNSADNNLQTAGKKKSGNKSGKKKVVDGENHIGNEHILTGGHNPAKFIPTNPAQLKALTDVTRMNLEMRIKLGELIDRSILDLYIDKIAQGINQFVNLSRLVSTDICQKLDRMGMERDVEKIINPKVKSIIEQIIETCNNAKK